MEKESKINNLIDFILSSNNLKVDIPDDEVSQKRFFRAYVNTRMPKPASKEFLQLQDEYLQEQLGQKGITDVKDLTAVKGDIYLWQGDITTLKCDAIVNAANSQMLGCFCPNHGCIDNAIHTFAGVQLRLECAEIMEKQGYEEPTGQAKITRAYNLPCKHVLHTVGPIVRGALTPQLERELESCYNSCLKLADKNNLQSVAFCCISTGEFCFPSDRAAEIAIKTVEDYKANTASKIKVIFNVFKDMDYAIYSRLLQSNCQA